MKKPIALTLILVVIGFFIYGIYKYTLRAPEVGEEVGTASAAEANSTEVELSEEATVVAKFYKSYIGHIPTGKVLVADFFSESFKNLIEQDNQICAAKAGTDICGWGADGDPYLNAQELDSQLSFDSSKFAVAQTEPGIVEVSFNVFPEVTDHEKTDEYYSRRIKFVMIQENGKWVVEDMIYVYPEEESSSRKQLENEIRFYQKK